MSRQVGQAGAPQPLDEYILPNAYYILRGDRVICRFALRLAAAPDRARLQQALRTVLPRCGYFAMQLVWQGQSPHLVPGSTPCMVYEGSGYRRIPGDTNGYLFSMACEGEWIYLDWYHFLADGAGIFPLLIETLRVYYGLPGGGPIPCDAPYPAQQAPAIAPDAAPRAGDVRGAGQNARRTVLRVPYAGFAALAAKYDARPVSCLAGLMSMAMAGLVSGDTVAYSYAVDNRRAMGVPGARYNCVVNNRGQLPKQGCASLAQLLPGLDEAVRAQLQPEAMRAQMARQYGFVHQIWALQAPLAIKRRVFQMGENAGAAAADLWLSWMGDILAGLPEAIAAGVQDFEVWVPPNVGPLWAEAFRLKDWLVLNVQDQLPDADLPALLCGVLQREGLAVQSCRQLPPIPLADYRQDNRM